MATIFKTSVERAAFRLGAITSYLKVYEQVMRDLEAQDNVQLLIGPVNTLLARMHLRKQSAAEASIELNSELQSQKSRYIVMAAAVDIMLNERMPGETVTVIPTSAETFARVH